MQSKMSKKVIPFPKRPVNAEIGHIEITVTLDGAHTRINARTPEARESLLRGLVQLRGRVAAALLQKK